LDEKVKTFKRRVHQILEGFGGEKNDKVRQYVNLVLISLIALNILAVVFSSEAKFYNLYSYQLRLLQLISIPIFTVEYLLRLWVCDFNPLFRGLKGRIKYMLTPFMFGDLLALLHFYMPGIVQWDMRFLRILRFGKMMSILRFSKYSHALRTLIKVMKKKKEAIRMSLSFMISVLLISSCFIYYIEHKVQPEAFSSIPAAMWWSVITLTTIGYGDIYPITPLGKFFGSVVAFFGVGLFALPAGIFGAGLVEEMQQKTQKTVCPYCGKHYNLTGSKE
jgi:voltage-gated potassium channel